MGKSAKKGKAQVTEYRMSIHFGTSYPVDALTGIYVNEKAAWEGFVDYNQEIDIYKPDLFGGQQKEGGLAGRVYPLFGRPDQTIGSWLRDKLTGLIGVPDFRGQFSIFFSNLPADSRPGFLWTNNSPYLRPVWLRLRRSPKGLDEELMKIDPFGKTVNPIGMIFELLTNNEWGMGHSVDDFNIAEWNGYAQRLKNEGIGLAALWSEQKTIEEFIDEIKRHIDASVFQSVYDGKWRVNLIRDDYVAADLFEVNPGNATLASFQRRGDGEITNSITVKWTDPANEEQKTVAYHDLGSIAAQGATINDTKDYYMVRDAGLASKLAVRDLRAAVAPLASAEIVINRKGWRIEPGQAFRFTWPSLGITNLVMRVTKVNLGTLGQSSIRLTCIEDVFALPNTIYSAPETAWQDTSEAPRPVSSALQQVITPPAYLVDYIDGNSLDYPEARAAVLATQDGNDTFTFELQAYTPDVSGNMDWRSLGNYTPLGYGLMPATMPREVRTAVASLQPLYGSTRPAIGQFVWIGDTGSFNEHAGNEFGRAEIALIESGDAESGWVLRRGVLDTQPLSWPANTPFWVIATNVSIYDTVNMYSVGSTVQYRILPRTSQGTLNPAQATPLLRTLSDRPYRPFRPANVKVNGVLWGGAYVGGGVQTFSWANRHRRGESGQVLAWDEESIVPEPTQRTVVEIFHSAQAVKGAIPAARKIVEGSSATFTDVELVGGGSLPLVNWNAENGVVGWTIPTGAVFESRNDIGVLEGVHYFYTKGNAITAYQDVALTTLRPIKLRWAQAGISVTATNNRGTIGIHFLDANFGIIDLPAMAPMVVASTWIGREFTATPPEGSAYARIVFQPDTIGDGAIAIDGILVDAVGGSYSGPISWLIYSTLNEPEVGPIESFSQIRGVLTGFPGVTVP